MKQEVNCLILLILIGATDGQITNRNLNCMITINKVSRGCLENTILQRINLQKLMANLKFNIEKSKVIKCNDYKFEKVLTPQLPIQSTLDPASLMLVMELHKKLIESFSKSIRRVLADPRCNIDASKSKQIINYIDAYISKYNQDVIDRRQNEMQKEPCNAKRTNVNFNPPDPDSYTNYGTNSCLGKCEEQLTAIGNELNLLFNILQLTYTKGKKKKLLIPNTRC